MFQKTRVRDNHEQDQKQLVIQSVPELEKGINLIQKPADMPAFQALISHNLEGGKGEAVWIDAGNESSTYALASHGSNRLLEKVSIGRSFTPFQHHQSVQELEEFITERTELLVLPNITQLYTNGQLNQIEAEQLFHETWQKITELQQRHQIKVLISVPDEDDTDIGFKARMSADNKITIEDTSQGLKYDSQGFETYFYREDKHFQTTIPYWSRKIEETAQIKVRNR